MFLYARFSVFFNCFLLSSDSASSFSFTISLPVCSLYIYIYIYIYIYRLHTGNDIVNENDVIL